MGTIRKDVRETYLLDHPEDESMLSPFLSGFFVTWGRQRKEYNALLKVFFLSPENHLKEAYGFENEIMLVYAPFPTMEPRTLQAVEQIFAQSPAKGRVETLNYFLVSDAPDVRDWLDAYTSSRQESRIIVSFTKSELEQHRGDSWFIRNRLDEQFFGRDLFNYSLPLVEDTYFFGRQQLLMEYYDAIKRKENKAIFGLRKTGKTSFLFKLKRLIENEKVATTIYIDCKQPDIRKSRWYELLEEIATKISKNFAIDENFDFTERKGSKSFFQLIENARAKNGTICIFFDEIEFVSFVAKLDKHWHEDFVDFWQTMWSCQSQLKNFSFIISGVNPSVVETDIVNGVQNPLFGIVSHRYLTGFAEEEVRTMIKSLGKRMGLQFTYEAITEIFSWYGGHPLLTRISCSWFNTILSSIQSKPIKIDQHRFKQSRQRCDNELVFYCAHVVSELREFYPDEYFMLELFASGQKSDFADLAENASYLRHLMNYGIISKNNSTFISTIPVVTQHVGLELARKERRQLIFKVIDKKDRQSWLTRRLEGVLTDIRVLEKLVKTINGPSLFGQGSFPEADKFKETCVVQTQEGFSAFINTCNRCFVEPIDSYGKSIHKNDYFWKDIKKTYPALWAALHKVRIYRNERDHIELNANVNQRFTEMLTEDLEGRPPSQVEDLYFVLQQRVLDSLFRAIQIEINELS